MTTEQVGTDLHTLNADDYARLAYLWDVEHGMVWRAEMSAAVTRENHRECCGEVRELAAGEGLV